MTQSDVTCSNMSYTVIILPDCRNQNKPGKPEINWIYLD